MRCTERQELVEEDIDGHPNPVIDPDHPSHVITIFNLDTLRLDGDVLGTSIQTVLTYLAAPGESPIGVVLNLLLEEIGTNRDLSKVLTHLNRISFFHRDVLLPHDRLPYLEGVVSQKCKSVGMNTILRILLYHIPRGYPM